MKICIIASHLFRGGFTTSMLNMMEACLKQGIHVDVLFLEEDRNDPSISLPNGVQKITLNSLKQIPSSDAFADKWKELLLRFQMRMLNAKTQKNERESVRLVQMRLLYHVLHILPSVDLSDYQAVISWEELLCNYFLAFRVKARKKIGYIHPDYKQSMMDRSVDFAAFKKMDQIVCVSKASTRVLEETFSEFKKKIVTVYNPLNVERINTLQELSCQFKFSDSFTILTVARLDMKSKAFDRVVRVCKMLEDAGLSFDWYICGEGTDRSIIESMIAESNVKHLHLLGNQTNPYAFMRQADVFVLLSNYEGKPVVVDEAMYLNLPCVVTNYASANEQIKDGFNGRVVSMNDQACFEAIKELMEDQSKLDQLRYELEIEKKEKYTEIDDFIKLIKS